MQFNLATWIMNPFVLMMITVFLGMLFGKLKFGKFTFGVSGCLFIAAVGLLPWNLPANTLKAQKPE